MRPPKGREWLTEYDSAKRYWDTLQLHYTVLTLEQLLAKPFVAIRLSDGGSDNTIYETRADAIRLQRSSVDGNLCMYHELFLDRPPVEACDALLWSGRTAYKNGYRPVTAHAGAQLILPTRVEQLNRRPILAPEDDKRSRW